MDRMTRAGVAIGATAAVLVFLGWLDGTVIVDAQHRQGQVFDPTGLAWAYALGSLVTAVAVLGVGLAGWWARSWITGVAFVVGGAFFALLDVITWRLAAYTNDGPPVLPEPLATAVSQLYFWQGGPIGSMRIVGAAAFVVGVVVIGASLRMRNRVPAGQPELPAEHGSMTP